MRFRVVTDGLSLSDITAFELFLLHSLILYTPTDTWTEINPYKV